MIQEEIRELELAGDFEAAAKIRQQLRDVKRLEKKEAEEALVKAAAQDQQGENFPDILTDYTISTFR